MGLRYIEMKNSKFLNECATFIQRVKKGEQPEYQAGISTGVFAHVDFVKVTLQSLTSNALGGGQISVLLNRPMIEVRLKDGYVVAQVVKADGMKISITGNLSEIRCGAAPADVSVQGGTVQLRTSTAIFTLNL